MEKRISKLEFMPKTKKLIGKVPWLQKIVHQNVVGDANVALVDDMVVLMLTLNVSDDMELGVDMA
jgi:hypothetical protein